MGDDTRNDTIMDLDLNQEPLDSSTGSDLRFGSLLNELENAHGQIEERIRQLEAVTTRARQRQRWRQAAENQPEASGRLMELLYNTDLSVHSQEEGTGERTKNCKRDRTCLVAKALELDIDGKTSVGDGGGFFDCNVCLNMAREPILTCCGHMFCWACFYQLPYVDSTAKECPVCKGEVMETSVVPIYGNGGDSQVLQLGARPRIPPRPQANRVESIRQQHVNRGLSHSPIAEALRRIRMGIGARGEPPQQQDFDGANTSSNMPVHQVPVSSALSSIEIGGFQRLHSLHFSRVLSESAASLSSISSAINTAERLVEDLESYLHNRPLRRTDADIIPINDINAITRSNAVMQSEYQAVEFPAGINSAGPLASSAGRRDSSVADVHLVNMTNDVENGNNTIPISFPSPRRRIRIVRVSDADNETSHELQRRRLS